MLKLQLYLKPSTIGLCFGNKAERETFWTLLGENQNCAERFGERTIRFYPDKATAKFSIPLETESPQVIAEAVEIKQLQLKPVSNVPVVPTAPEPIAPVAIIPAETVYVESSNPIIPQMSAFVGVESPVAPTPPTPQPPPLTIPIPQIGSVGALGGVPATPIVTEMTKPPDMRSRAGRAWKAQQDAAK